MNYTEQTIAKINELDLLYQKYSTKYGGMAATVIGFELSKETKIKILKKHMDILYVTSTNPDEDLAYLEHAFITGL